MWGVWPGGPGAAGVADLLCSADVASGANKSLCIFLSSIAMPLQAVLLSGCAWSGRAGMAQGLLAVQFSFQR